MLLSAALLAARGCREDADFLLVRAAYLRPNQAFGNAAAQLRYLMLPHETAVVELLLAQILDGLDHPEIWAAMPAIVGCFPSLSAQIERLAANELNFYTEMWSVVYAVCIAADGLRTLEPIAVAHSQSTLVQGAYFHLKSLAHPDEAISAAPAGCRNRSVISLSNRGRMSGIRTRRRRSGPASMTAAIVIATRRRVR